MIIISGGLIRIREHKVWILKRRIHHGLVGVTWIAGGIAMCIHDRSDFREWFRLTLHS